MFHYEFIIFYLFSSTKLFFWPFLERNLNPKAACLKRREEEKVEEEAPEKRAVPGVDKPFDTTGAAAAGRGRGRRGRRSSRGGWVFTLVASLFNLYSLEYFRYRMLDLGLAFALLLFIAFSWIVTQRFSPVNVA